MAAADGPRTRPRPGIVDIRRVGEAFADICPVPEGATRAEDGLGPAVDGRDPAVEGREPVRAPSDARGATLARGRVPAPVPGRRLGVELPEQTD